MEDRPQWSGGVMELVAWIMLDPFKDFPRGLKPQIVGASGGTAKAVPFQN
jgi:hypothetical protein